MQVDLGLVSSVKQFIEEYCERFDSLDVLINNAADFDLSRKTPAITSEHGKDLFENRCGSLVSS